MAPPPIPDNPQLPAVRLDRDGYFVYDDPDVPPPAAARAPDVVIDNILGDVDSSPLARRPLLLLQPGEMLTVPVSPAVTAMVEMQERFSFSRARNLDRGCIKDPHAFLGFLASLAADKWLYRLEIWHPGSRHKTLAVLEIVISAYRLGLLRMRDGEWADTSVGYIRRAPANILGILQAHMRVTKIEPVPLAKPGRRERIVKLD